MEKVFSYINYRVFLKERFEQLKKTRRATYRSLAKKAGFASPNFLKLVIDGDRNLTEQSIPKIIQAMSLEGREAEFFSALVFFNQAKNFEEKESAYERLKKTRKDLQLQRIEHSQFEYFTHWYVVAIRELMGLKDFCEDPQWIQKKLGGRINITQIRKGLELLEELKLVERQDDGSLKSKQAMISTGDEVSSVAAYRFQQDMIDQAKEALEKTPAAQREISSVTISLSHKLFSEIKNKIQLFRREILTLAHECDEAEAVYQLNIQFFNLSEVPWDESEKSSSL